MQRLRLKVEGVRAMSISVETAMEVLSLAIEALSDPKVQGLEGNDYTFDLELKKGGTYTVTIARKG
jgi:hypothetical protein